MPKTDGRLVTIYGHMTRYGHSRNLFEESKGTKHRRSGICRGYLAGGSQGRIANVQIYDGGIRTTGAGHGNHGALPIIPEACLPPLTW
jgi:hypothetical protein